MGAVIVTEFLVFAVSGTYFSERGQEAFFVVPVSFLLLTLFWSYIALKWIRWP